MLSFVFWCKWGMLLIKEIDDEILIFIVTLKVAAAFVLTHSSSLCTHPSVQIDDYSQQNQADRALGRTLSETAES